MALTNSLEQSADIELKGGLETAKILSAYRARREGLPPEAIVALDKLRDALSGIATEEPAHVYHKQLALYLDAAPNMQAPESAPTAINDNPVPESPVTAVEAATEPVSEVPDMSAIPIPSFMSRDRVTQFNAPEVIPEPAPAQKIEASAVPVEVTLPVVNQEPTEKPIEAQKETPKEELKAEADLTMLPEPSALEVVAAVQEKAAEIPTPQPERPAGIEAAAKEIESINNELNEFGGWHALVWINDPETGYRDYMKKLIAARDAVIKARSGAGTPDLAAITTELRSLAEGVRRAVKGEQKDELAQSTAPETVATVATPAVETAAVNAETPVATPAVAETPVPLKVEATVPEVAAWSHQVPESPSAPVMENIAAAIEDSVSASQEAPALNVHELPRVPVEQAVPAAVEVPQDAVPEEPEVHAETDPTFLTEPGVAEVVQAINPDAAVPNPEIYSPKIQEELSELLTKWLGSDGWLIKKSGLEHPDWHKMAPLTVGEVMEAAKKGENHGGLQATMIDNLASNLRKWGELYGISMLQHEDTTINEMMHRIVFEFKKP